MVDLRGLLFWFILPAKLNLTCEKKKNLYFSPLLSRAKNRNIHHMTQTYFWFFLQTPSFITILRQASALPALVTQPRGAFVIINGEKNDHFIVVITGVYNFN